MIDREAAIPLYHQIFLRLRDEILSGQRPFGSLLPTEQDLAASFAVSRITARRVLDELAREHFVARKRRVGTTVTFRSPAKPIEANIDQALDSLLALGHGTRVHVIEIEEQTATPVVSDALGLGAGARVIHAVRVRFLDDVPIGYVESYVPAAFAPIMTHAALGTTPMLRILEEAGHRPANAEQTIGAMLADRVMAAALGIELRDALLRIVRTVQDRHGKPILLTFAHYRSDRFHIRLDLNPPGTSPSHHAAAFAANSASSSSSE